MKGTISLCLLEMLEKQIGKEKTKAIVQKSGASEILLRSAISDVPDDVFMNLFKTTLEMTGMSLEKACDAFGEYWCCTYAPRMYGMIVSNFKSAKEMILGMDQVHVQLTKTIPNARPPRFNYKWETEKRLLVTYQSKRNLIEVYIGLVKGVGKYFKEPLKVRKVDAEHVQIDFA